MPACKVARSFRAGFLSMSAAFTRLAANEYTSREAWLHAATAGHIASIFKSNGYAIPEAIRFAIGFPSTGRKSKAIGEHWPAQCSADAHHEIFIRPDISDPVEVLAILMHELVHAAVPPDSGHGRVFRKAALAVGLAGKMTSTVASETLKAELMMIAAQLGELPHARLDFSARGADTPKKQGTRMIKCACDECGYTVRTARKWLAIGVPGCPSHGAMTVECSEQEDDE
jgi:hypothetical protein